MGTGRSGLKGKRSSESRPGARFLPAPDSASNTTTTTTTDEAKITATKNSVVVQGGKEIDLSDMPLQYGEKADLGDKTRAAVDAQEKKRLKAKIEYAACYDSDGNIIGGEVRGRSGSVPLTHRMLSQAEVLTHNHPRSNRDGSQNETLGGTFSEADMNVFSNYANMKTIRASAAEGTYTMTKGAGFDASKFNSYVKQVNQKHNATMKSELDGLRKDYIEGRITSHSDYVSKADKAFNRFLVNVHNDLVSGQKDYGYKYSLEER